MNLFPPIAVTQSELTELANKINEPVIKKYLTHLARDAINEIVHAQRKPGETAESFLERVASVRGGLSTLETLLDIEKPAQTAANL